MCVSVCVSVCGRVCVCVCEYVSTDHFIKFMRPNNVRPIILSTFYDNLLYLHFMTNLVGHKL